MKGCEYFVCYFDILGQRDWMKDALSDGALADDKHSELNLIVGSQRAMRGIFYDRIREFAKSKQCEIHEGYDYGVQQFSDSTILYVRKDLMLAPAILFLLLLDVSFHMLEFQAIGLYFRGSVTVGYACHVSGGQLCGQALDEADELERRTAVYSRIVVSDRLVQCVERSLADKSVTDERRSGFLDLKSLFEWGPDTECAINIFTPVIPESMNKEEGRKGVYNRYIWAARKHLAENCGKVFGRGVDWKYQLLVDAYLSHEPYISKYVGDRPKEPFRYKVSDTVETGDYLVCYLRFMPLTALPKSRSEFEKNFYFFGESTANDFTVSQIVRMLKQLRKIEGLGGVQQIGNYILFYSRYNEKPSRKSFVRACLSIRERLVYALNYDHLVSASVVCGPGWEMEADCLLGPVVGEADKLAVRNAPYPRFVLADDSRIPEEIRKASFRDHDGVLSYDELSGDVLGAIGKSGNDPLIVLYDGLVRLTMRQMLMWHFSFRSDRTSAFARQIGFYIRSLRKKISALGLGRLVEDAKKFVDSEMESKYGVKVGDPPAIIARYAVLPDIPTRGIIASTKVTQVAQEVDEVPEMQMPR